MSKYILRRLIMTIPTLVVISMIIFIVLRVIPGNIVATMFGGAPEAEEARASRWSIRRPSRS